MKVLGGGPAGIVEPAASARGLSALARHLWAMFIKRLNPNCHQSCILTISHTTVVSTKCYAQVKRYKFDKNIHLKDI